MRMSWAARRRFFILLIVGSFLAAFLTVIAIATFYKAPSCGDGVENQGEAGIDCGGPCARLCLAQVVPPTVLFTKAFPTSAGRTVVVAQIENKNAMAAAHDVPYSVILYGEGQTLIQTVSGTLDLPPGAAQTVFIPAIVSGRQTVASAFLTIDPASPDWVTMAADPRIMPTVSNTTQIGSIDTPRIDTTLVNASVMALTNIQVVVLVRDTNKDVIAASGTIVPVLPAQGSATATFTWNSAFPGVPALIEVVPVIPLPVQAGSR